MIRVITCYHCKRYFTTQAKSYTRCRLCNKQVNLHKCRIITETEDKYKAQRVTAELLRRVVV